MFCPLENVPTTMPELLTATDWSWPAAKPFWVMPLMVAAPLELANCVNAPWVMLKERLPNDCPSTLTPGMVMDDPEGEVSAPLAPKVKFVPTFTHSGVVPLAVVDVW